MPALGFLSYWAISSLVLSSPRFLRAGDLLLSVSEIINSDPNDIYLILGASGMAVDVDIYNERHCGYFLLKLLLLCIL